MTSNTLINQIKTSPNNIEFDEVILSIANKYNYNPCRFYNGVGSDKVVNEAGTNEGSCKIFAFAKLNELSESETLACFGTYYRDDVLKNPEGSDHANIRTFMRHGWEGISFDEMPLTPK